VNLNATTIIAVFPPGLDVDEGAVRIALANEGAIEVNGDNVCEGCVHCQYPGIRWPASPDGDSSRSYVERCDTCERFPGDLHAAFYVALNENVGVGIARVFVESSEGGIVFAPVKAPIYADLSRAWSNAGSGTAVFLDHPALDS
jgi:hypothetical protein